MFLFSAILLLVAVKGLERLGWGGKLIAIPVTAAAVLLFLLQIIAWGFS